MLALLLYVHSVCKSLVALIRKDNQCEKYYGPRVCVVRPTIRERSNSSSSASTLWNFGGPAEWSSEGEEEGEDSSEEEFIWRLQGGGGWNGWRDY